MGWDITGMLHVTALFMKCLNEMEFFTYLKFVFYT